jgi:hypothetical protein
MKNKKALQDYKEGIPVDLAGLAEILGNGNISLEDAKWGLIRSRDKLSKYSNEIGFIEYHEDGTFKKIVKGIKGLKVGRNLILAPFSTSYTWQTTAITEILETEDGDNIRFKTNNSKYTLIDFEQDEE